MVTKDAVSVANRIIATAPGQSCSGGGDATAETWGELSFRLEDDVEEAVKQIAQRNHSQDQRRNRRERDYG